jgi:hypothetical protein
MRVSSTTIIMSLAATLMWLSGLALSTEAAAPDGYPTTESGMAACQGPCMAQPTGEGAPVECNVPCECVPRCPCWAVTAEAIVLQRSATRSQPLYAQPQTASVDALDAKDLNFPMALGYQISAIRRNVCGCDWEVAYFQVDGFNAEATVPGASLMITDVNNVGFLVNNGSARYSSAIYSGEVNARHEWFDGFTTIAGFRMGQLNEHYFGGGTEAFVPSRTDTLGIDTSNQFYGFQLGADYGIYDMGGPLRINILCKAGIYDNYARQCYRRLIVDGSTVISNDQFWPGRNQASFLGETGAVLTYSLTKRLAFRASARAMWLTDVALAPEQIGGVNLRLHRDTINTFGTAFYYGAGAGLEYRF